MRTSLAEKLGLLVNGRPIDGKEIRSLLRESMYGRVPNRDVLTRAMEAAFLDLDTYEWFLTQVAIVKNGNYVDNMAPLTMDQLNGILDDGLQSLSDDEISRLATNPIALMCMKDEAWRADGEAWEEVQTLIGEELLEIWPLSDETQKENYPEMLYSTAASPVKAALVDSFAELIFKKSDACLAIYAENSVTSSNDVGIIYVWCSEGDDTLELQLRTTSGLFAPQPGDTARVVICNSTDTPDVIESRLRDVGAAFNEKGYDDGEIIISMTFPFGKGKQIGLELGQDSSPGSRSSRFVVLFKPKGK